MWGTGASSTQCEGAAPASDWWDHERTGQAPDSGDGNGFAGRYGEDFVLLAELGLHHHRLSIEWARVEPEEGRHDEAAIEHYRDMLAAAQQAGIAPWVCLHHFTLPRWFGESGGFLVEENRTEVWARHVDFVADTFGDLVDGWQPVNEMNYYAGLAYGGGQWPPGHDDRTEKAMVHEAIHLATAEAAVRLRSTTAPVASIFGLSAFVPLDDSPETAAVVERSYASMWDPGIGLYRDGVLRCPHREPVQRPDLAGCFDLIGFSFYANTGVSEGQRVQYPIGAPVSPLGYGIDGAGVALVLDRLHEVVPGAPLLVAEFGVGTDDDEFRAAYLRAGLGAIADALARGIDVRGFFHWTAVDNYEWHHGFDVSFGIIDRDRNVRPSALVLHDATHGRA